MIIGGLVDNTDVVCAATLNQLLVGNMKIEKRILSKKEKIYLENILEPFKDRVIYIKKIEPTKETEYLCIKVNNYKKINCFEHMVLPYFEKNTMYKNMKPDQEYNLEELGLFKKGE